MTTKYITAILVLLSTAVMGQMTTQEYIGRGNSRGPMPCYYVTTIRINSDSTYTRTDYKCGEKRTWRNYKKWESETSTGTIQKEGKYYKMTEYRDNQSTMNDIKRIRLSGLQLFTHYALPLLILTAPILSLVSIIQILTDNYDGIRTIDEHMSTSIPFLIIGLLLIYRQYRRLNFKVFTIDHSDRDFQHAIGKTGMELKWRTERNRDGYYRAYRVGMDGPWWWGEMITIIRDNNRIYINSVSDPNQSPTPSSFGWDRKNVRTFIRNLQTIVTENNERTNRPTANTGFV